MSEERPQEERTVYLGGWNTHLVYEDGLTTECGIAISETYPDDDRCPLCLVCRRCAEKKAMSKPKTAPDETRWAHYRHKEKPEIEYDVEVHPGGEIVEHVFKDEWCYQIRTIRNLAYEEQAHQPAYTMMPSAGFLDVYERVEG